MIVELAQYFGEMGFIGFFAGCSLTICLYELVDKRKEKCQK